MKKLEPPYEYENLEDDFCMPYKKFGIFDAEVMKHKYIKLTNKPKHLLQLRFTVHQW